jgi:phosphomannomutase
MHGVGTPFVLESFARFGLPEPVMVEAQIHPDPEFPTVAFPNPEEGKGALALAMQAADAAGSRIIIANDPDADRLAVAEKEGEEWHVFTGNETGAMLGHWMWRSWRKANPDADASNVYMLASTVSSSMLGAMAAAEGFKFEDTLTGFKWMGSRTAELRASGKTVIFSFEEAIGFCCGDVVKDKDGVGAACALGELATELYREGRSLRAYMHELYTTYGYFVTNNRYVFCHDPRITDSIFERLRAAGRYQLMLGPHRVMHIRDLTSPGLDTSTPDLRPTLPTSSSHMITYTFANGATLTLRTSGTEPKIKYYTELSGPDPGQVAEELQGMVDLVISDMLEADKHGLARPE